MGFPDFDHFTISKYLALELINAIDKSEDKNEMYNEEGEFKKQEEMEVSEKKLHEFLRKN